PPAQREVEVEPAAGKAEGAKAEAAVAPHGREGVGLAAVKGGGVGVQERVRRGGGRRVEPARGGLAPAQPERPADPPERAVGVHEGEGGIGTGDEHARIPRLTPERPQPHAERADGEGPAGLGRERTLFVGLGRPKDRKSTRLNSSHVKISYAVFC